MLDPKGREWWPKIDPITPPPEPLTPVPPLAMYDLRPCWKCGALIDRELCGYCEFRFTDEVDGDYPALAAMRRDVRELGELPEWANHNHTDMQTNHLCRPGYWQGWRGVVTLILTRAGLRSDLFWPDYFREDEAA